MVRERNGNRSFEKMSRWNSLEYSFVSPRNINAKYADNPNSGAKQLAITFFRRNGKVFPLKRFEKLDKPIILEDFSVLTMKDTGSDYWLEVDKNADKIRVYEEIKECSTT